MVSKKRRCVTKSGIVGSDDLGRSHTIRKLATRLVRIVLPIVSLVEANGVLGPWAGMTMVAKRARLSCFTLQGAGTLLFWSQITILLPANNLLVKYRYRYTRYIPLKVKTMLGWQVIIENVKHW
jgi:hypothetical protein